MTNNRTRWEKHLNDVRLEDRLIDIEKWRNELERVLRKGLYSLVDQSDQAIRQIIACNELLPFEQWKS